jgi:hypothetical protein
VPSLRDSVPLFVELTPDLRPGLQYPAPSGLERGDSLPLVRPELGSHAYSIARFGMTKSRKSDSRYFLCCVGCGPFSSVSRSQIQPSRV